MNVFEILVLLAGIAVSTAGLLAALRGFKETRLNKFE